MTNYTQSGKRAGEFAREKVSYEPRLLKHLTYSVCSNGFSLTLSLCSKVEKSGSFLIPTYPRTADNFVFSLLGGAQVHILPPSNLFDL